MRAHLRAFRGGRARAAVFLLLLIVIPACRGRTNATVTGTVKYDGAIVPSGQVIFYGARDQFASAYIDQNGHYEAANVPLGKVRVGVSTGPSSAAMDKAAKQMKNRFGKGNPYPSSVTVVSIPTKYSDPAKSGLELTVTEGVQKFDIALP
jgi:hypothetical protein